MTHEALAFRSALALGAMILDKAVSSTEVVGTYLERIERFDTRLHAYITVTGEQALRAARATDARVAAGGTLGPLDGVPFAVKDQFDTTGIRTTPAWVASRRRCSHWTG